MSNDVAIRPNDNWLWFFSYDYDRLMLKMESDLQFCSRYTSKMLIQSSLKDSLFTVNDATKFYQFYQSCSQLKLTEDEKIALTLNAIVASNFLKPQMPKSWYFTQKPSLFTPTDNEIVEAQVLTTGQSLNLLVIESNVTASVCLMTENNVKISGKTFSLGDPLKIMNDRLASKSSSLGRTKLTLEDGPSTDIYSKLGS